MKPIWETEDMRAATSWQPKKTTQAAWPPTFDGDDGDGDGDGDGHQHLMVMIKHDLQSSY